MKKALFALIALILAGSAVAVGPPAAHAASTPDCWWSGHLYCQWVVNPTFDAPNTPAPWVYSPGATFPSDVRCGYATRLVKMKRVSPETVWFYQRMYIGASAGPQAQVFFRLELRDDINSWWDQLRITVKNLDTNVTEIKDIHGNAFNSTCPVAEIVWNLANDYTNHAVELKFEISNFSTGTFIVDDVQFWTID